MTNEHLSFQPPGNATGGPEQPAGNQENMDNTREELFRVMVNSIKDYAIFMLDPDGYVQTWNEGAQSINGYTEEEIVAKHFSTFYTQEAKDSNHPANELEIAKSTGRYEETGWRVRKDGSTFWANVVITALFDQSGELIGFAKVTRDLTERKKAAEEREQAAQALAQTNEELQRLAYVISHELQAPISVITRYGNLLTVRYKDRLGADANDFISKIGEASNLIARMIDDLWTYARISKPDLPQEQVYVRHAISDAVGELKDMVDEEEVIISEMPSLRGNRQQLQYLFKELICNAVKYRSSAPPRITIDALPDDGGWLFSVADNGIGIDAVHRAEIFRLFHRLTGGPQPIATGMGLAICKKIVERHKGRIWIESDPGKGTTVKFWIPDIH